MFDVPLHRIYGIMRKLVLFSKIKQKKITFDVTMGPQFLPQENNNENSEYSSPLKEEGLSLSRGAQGKQMASIFSIKSSHQVGDTGSGAGYLSTEDSRSSAGNTGCGLALLLMGN